MDSGTAAQVAVPESFRKAKKSAIWRDPYFWANWMVVIAFVVVTITFTAVAPHNFATLYNINNILVATAIPALVSIGQAFVIMTAGIDLSVPSLLALSAVVFGILFAHGSSLLVCSIFAILTGAIAGFINGFVIAQFKINDFIVTLGSLSVASGVALVFSDGKPVQIISASLSRLAVGRISVVPYLMVITLIALVVAHLVLTQTRFGTYVYATGGDPEVARAMGIKVKWIKIAVYTISGLLCGVASILTIARIGSAEPSSNTSILLNSVAAVVLGGVSLFGGRGTVIGTFIGAVLLQVVINGLTVVGVPQYYQYIAVGAVVIFSAVLVRSAK